jgi:hypothetical protein
MHPSVRRFDAQVIAQTAPDGRDEYISLQAVHLPHFADVSREMPPFHDGGDDRLAESPQP